MVDQSFLSDAKTLAALVEKPQPIDRVVPLSTAIYSLDHALGGGIAPGVTDIHGPPNVGKTAICASLLLSAQQKDVPVLYVPGDYYAPGMLSSWNVDVGDLALVMGGDLDLRVDRKEEHFLEFTIAVQIVKNLLKAPGVNVDIPFHKVRGLEVELDLVNLALKLGVLERSGSWIKLDGQALAQGVRDTANLFRMERPLFYRVWRQVL